MFSCTLLAKLAFQHEEKLSEKNNRQRYRCGVKAGSTSGVVLSLAGSENDFPPKQEVTDCAAWVLTLVCTGGEAH